LNQIPAKQHSPVHSLFEDGRGLALGIISNILSLGVATGAYKLSTVYKVPAWICWTLAIVLLFSIVVLANLTYRFLAQRDATEHAKADMNLQKDITAKNEQIHQLEGLLESNQRFMQHQAHWRRVIYAHVPFMLSCLMEENAFNLGPQTMPTGMVDHFDFDDLNNSTQRKVREELTLVSGKLVSALSNAMRMCDAVSQIDDPRFRVAVFIPQRIGNWHPDHEHPDDAALFMQGTSDARSRTLDRRKYLVRGQGVAGSCWVLGRARYWREGQNGLVELHEDIGQTHHFRELICVPIYDTLNPARILAILSMDSEIPGTLIQSDEDIEKALDRVVQAVQLARAAISGCIRHLQRTEPPMLEEASAPEGVN
jgi:hypothetical protein